MTALGVLPAVSLSENLRFIPPCCRFLLQAAVEIPGVTERLFVRVIDFILCFMRNGGINGFIPACPDENKNRTYDQLIRTTLLRVQKIASRMLAIDLCTSLANHKCHSRNGKKHSGKKC